MLPLVFNLPPAFPQLAMVAYVTEELVQKGAQDFGFERWVASLGAVVTDDAIDLVDITTVQGLDCLERVTQAIGKR